MLVPFLDSNTNFVSAARKREARSTSPLQSCDVSRLECLWAALRSREVKDKKEDAPAEELLSVSSETELPAVHDMIRKTTQLHSH